MFTFVIENYSDTPTGRGKEIASFTVDKYVAEELANLMHIEWPAEARSVCSGDTVVRYFKNNN